MKKILFILLLLFFVIYSSALIFNHVNSWIGLATFFSGIILVITQILKHIKNKHNA